MLRLLEDETLPGGTVLEVGRGNSRLVTAFNDPGPQGDGHKVSKSAEAVIKVHQLLEEDGWGKSK
jgi:hypothetical protein